MSERQMATCLDEVRADHLQRYEFAIAELKKRGRTGHVIDAGCGIGYGSSMLADVVNSVSSVEISEEAYSVYQQHWQRDNISFHNCDLLKFECSRKVDAVVCFEFIEHVEFYEAAIEKFSQWSDLLIISTPNEDVRPHLQEPVNPYHHRHFRPSELEDVVGKYGLQIESWHCQVSGAAPDIVNGTAGKFIIAVCNRARVELGT
ncbi:MAG: hypothetical protein Aurels2KO_21230 [Aureliella sp.]